MVLVNGLRYESSYAQIAADRYRLDITIFNQTWARGFLSLLGR